MITVRYAEHLNFEKGLPFIFHRDVFKSPTSVTNVADWHEDIELIVCKSGNGYIMLDNERTDIEKGEIAIINSNMIHSIDSDTNLVYDCLIIDRRFCRLVDIDVASLVFKPTFTDKGLLDVLEKFPEIYADKENVCRTVKLYGCVAEILAYIRENCVTSENPHGVKGKNYDSVKKAIAFIRDNYSEKISLECIAKNVFVNKFTLSREFKKILGQSVVQYTNRYRCKCAAEMISQGISVSTAAEKCGFSNMSFFTKTFERYVGCLPSKYKK